MNKMNIAFIFSYPHIVASDGVYSQAMTWKKGLEDLNHVVTLVNMWNNYDWKSFDVILFFGFNEYMRDIIKWIYPINPNIAVAPILDPNYSLLALQCYARWGCSKLRLTNPYHSLRSIKDKIKVFLVRSNFEKRFLSKGFGISGEKCKIVPLSYSIPVIGEINHNREPFCLHISLLCDARKNVKRLIDASVKYQFRLVLCGLLRSKEEEQTLADWMRGKPNVSYLGYVTKERMIELYSKAKIFALPSTYEGVGIVALDAATMGCDIVITKLGGPKEYYSGKALEVNPYDTDEIGTAVKSFIDGKSFQPQLSKMIKETKSPKVLSCLLEETLSFVLK